MDADLGHVAYKAPKDINTWECGVKDDILKNVEHAPNMGTSTNDPDPKYLKVHFVGDHNYWAAKGTGGCRCITAAFQSVR